MNKILFGLMCAIIAMPAYSAPRHSTNQQLGRSTLQTGRATTIIVQTDGDSAGTVVSENSNDATLVGQPDKNEEERRICLANNIGFKNTFVWASRQSNTDNYATMIEDVNNPANNTCYAFVEIHSNDNSVDLHDIPGKYFPMGTRVTCGEWTDKKIIEQRILDAKKSSRTWATVAGSVGGAGIGVGAMELFGNKLLASAGLEEVQGQKALSGDDLFISQLKVLKKDKDARYTAIIGEIKQIKEGCDKNTIPECKNIDYERILKELEEI